MNPNPPDGNQPPNTLTWDYVNSPPPSTSFYSVLAVVTHEFGHFLSLRDVKDLSCSNVTMFHIIAPGQDNEITLEIEDMNGLNWQYP
jgi:hypothetical protein